MTQNEPVSEQTESNDDGQVLLHIRIPEAHLEAIDELVRRGFYASRPEFVRSLLNEDRTRRGISMRLPSREMVVGDLTQDDLDHTRRRPHGAEFELPMEIPELIGLLDDFARRTGVRVSYVQFVRIIMRNLDLPELAKRYLEGATP